MSRAVALLSLAMVLLSSSVGLTAEMSIQNLQLLELRPGANSIKRFMPDGRDVTILDVWRDNGNAHGYTMFMVMYRDPRGSWQLVDMDGKDSIADVPHTGEDNVTSVRFARGKVDGAKASLLIVAERKLDSGESYYDPATTTITYYRLVDTSDQGAGATPFEFRPIKTLRSRELYCNSDLALNKEAGLPLPETYDGPNTVDGCFPEKR